MQFILALLGDGVPELLDGVVDKAHRFGVTRVVGLHVRLHKQPVVEGELLIEPHATVRRQEEAFLRDVACMHILRDEPAKSGHNDAVVVKHEAFYMS